MRHPYTKLFPKTPPRPYLKVFLRNGYHTSNEVMALVDSGADYPIFPMETAKDYLKLDLSRADSWTFTGTTGDKQEAKLAEALMTVLDANGDALFQVQAVCAFCETFKMSGGVLLGQMGFFSSFQVTFRQPEQYFEIEEFAGTL